MIKKIFDKDSVGHELKPAAHTHSTSEVTGLAAAMAGKADTNHTHTGYAAASHTHDDRYYTETEVDTKLATKAAANHTHTGYAAASHTHDDRYYTETEVNSIKQDILSRIALLSLSPYNETVALEDVKMDYDEEISYNIEQGVNVVVFEIPEGVRKIEFNGKGNMFVFSNISKNELVNFIKSYNTAIEQSMKWHGEDGGTCTFSEIDMLVENMAVYSSDEDVIVRMRVA